MTRDELSWIELLAYCIVAVSGALGGCGVASHNLLRNKPGQIRLAQFIAYAILGTVGAVLTYSFSSMSSSTTTDLIGPSILSGYSFALLLGAGNLTARAVLKRLGKEVEITVKDLGVKDAAE